jgi:hypothetical protein
MINITFNKKKYFKGNVALSLSITNFLPESLKPIYILRFLVFFLITR